MTDYSVQVKNLPSKNSGAFDDLEQLKAQLSQHILDVVANEPLDLKGKNEVALAPEQIVNIHFALTSFSKYNVLI